MAGGKWEKDENTNWKNNILAYNLSVSCNHCEDAPCLKACPTKAIQKREDGIVYINAGKCMGCKYCQWACPYESPQYDDKKGIMTKCDFCRDYVDEGKDPSCVAACPMRALEFGEAEALKAKYAIADIYPFPDHHISKPALYIHKHKKYCAENKNLEVINREEISHG